MVTSSSCSKLRVVSLLSCAETAGHISSATPQRTSDELLEIGRLELGGRKRCIVEVVFSGRSVQPGRRKRCNLVFDRIAYRAIFAATPGPYNSACYKFLQYRQVFHGWRYFDLRQRSVNVAAPE